MRPESQLAGLAWDALEFARNAQIAVGEATLEDFLEHVDEGGGDWAEVKVMLMARVGSRIRTADESG